MSVKYKIILNYIKDLSVETPDPESLIVARERVSEYGLNLDISSKPLKNKMIEVYTKLIYRDKDVKGILINIFGGMMRCNDIAQGLVNASKEVGLDKPLVVRLEGTNVEMGMEILNNSGFPIKPVGTMEEAAQKVVEMVKG